MGSTLSKSESCEAQVPDLFKPLPIELVLYIMKFIDISDIVVLMSVCKLSASLLLKDSWNILYLSDDEKHVEEDVQFVTRTGNMGARIPVLMHPRHPRKT